MESLENEVVSSPNAATTTLKHVRGPVMGRWNELALLLLFAGIISFQLFVTPFIGMADNGDFKKVTGVFCLGPRDGDPHYYGFFVPRLVFDSKYCYSTDQIPTTEWMFTAVAVKLDGFIHNGPDFDIRVLGAVQALVFLAGYFALLVALRPRGRLVQTLLGLLALWIFTDVLYVAYLNSFYTDAAALLGASAAVPLAFIIVRTRRRPSLAMLLLFTAAVLIFGLSKAQHGLAAWAGSILLLTAGRDLPGRKRMVPVALALLPILASVYIVHRTPESIRAQPIFDVVMLRFLPMGPSPANMGGELNLTPDEMKLVGKHAFALGARPFDFVGFYHRAFPQLMKWYVSHPLATARWLYSDLRIWAPHLRFGGGGNFRVEDKKPFGTLTTRFASWSTMKGFIMRRFPLLLPMMFLLIIGMAIFRLTIGRKSTLESGWIYVLAGISLMCVVEYVAASLLDTEETDRHLFLFHALTDLTFVFGAAGVASWWPQRKTLNIKWMRVALIVGGLMVVGVLLTQTTHLPRPRGAAVYKPRDFRGDGRSGAFLYDPSQGQSHTVFSKGDGTFESQANLFSPNFDMVRTGDFNGDARADIILYNSKTSQAYVGLGNGDGTFAFVLLSWSAGYNIGETGDLDGDGRSDIALYNGATGTLYTGISDGSGAFRNQYHLVSSGFTYVRLADFTGDKKADLFLYDAATGQAILGVGDGKGAFTFGALTVSPGYDYADVGDLNGDGRSDLILYNSTNGNAVTGISNGRGGFVFTPISASPGFTSVVLADYTGDGKADVILYNKANALAYFGTGSGTGTFHFQSLFWSPGYDYAAAEDVNGDGKMDVVLFNSATGGECTGISNGSGGFKYTFTQWGAGKVLAR